MKINIPSNITGNYLQAYLDISNKLFEDSEIDTLFLSGSLYHGGAGVNSDLDFLAITSSGSDFFQRIQNVSCGVFYELFLYSQAQLKKSFDMKDYQDMHMVGYGFLVFSKNVNYSKIQNDAKLLFDKGPDKFLPKQLEYEKYLLWDKYKDLIDIFEENSVLTKSLMNLLLWDSLKFVYVDKCIWFPKKKKVLESLVKVDSDIYKFVIIFLNTESEKELLIILKEIVEKVIYPNNLEQPFIWQSDRKIL